MTIYYVLPPPKKQGVPKRYALFTVCDIISVKSKISGLYPTQFSEDETY